jgi:hypothetical protein
VTDSTTEWLADPRQGKKLKKRLEDIEYRVARSAAATDQSVVQNPPQSADETVPGGQRTLQCTGQDTQLPQYTVQTSSPPPTAMRSGPVPLVSIDTAPTPLESFFTPCSTPTFSDYSTEYFRFPLVSPHEHRVCEDSSPFSAGYAAMAGFCRSALG